MSYDVTAASDRTITAFFDDRPEADDAIDALLDAGIPRESIRLVPGSETSGSAEDSLGFWETLKDFLMPDEDRYTYAEGLRRGGFLLTVQADNSNYDRVLDILDDEGTVDITERETAWRSEGWSGYAGSELSDSGDALTSHVGGDYDLPKRGSMAGADTNLSNEEVIPVAAEELRVGKRDVSHGRVRVRSYVVETPVSEDVSLREENVTVTRRSVDRPLTGDERLFQDRTIEVEERAEEAVVAKEARITEELVINKEVGERVETVSDTVRHTEVEIEDERGSRPSKRASGR